MDDRLKQKYIEYWNRENHNRPLVSIVGTDNFEQQGFFHDSLRQRWFDIDYVIDRVNKTLENTYYGCEAYPMFFPDLGPDQFAAFHGTELEFGDTTSWSLPNYRDVDVEEIPKFYLDKNGIYYQKLLELMKAMLENGKGKYFTGIPDLHPGADCLVSMRGPQQLCIDTLENPEFIKERTKKLFPDFCQVFEDFYKMTQAYQSGTTNWMGVWYPEKWYVTSCDFSCMISTDMYEELIVPELLMEIDYLDASIYHLDGPDALKHLDRLLKIDNLKGVQWIYGAGAPTASYWLDTIRKIQSAGKVVHIEVKPEELEYMLQNVKPEGVFFQVNAESRKQAEELEKIVKKYD